MNESLSFKENLSIFVGVLSLMVQLTTFIGIVCIIIYLIQIGHLPQGLSFGDGLLFIIVAASFGFLYAIFVFALLSLGTILSPLINVADILFVSLKNLLSRRRNRTNFEFSFIEWATAIPGTCIAVWLILILGERDTDLLWALPVLSIFLYMACSVGISSHKKIYKIKKLTNTALYTQEREHCVKHTNTRYLKRACVISFVFTLILPLSCPGLFSEILNGAMRLSNIRVESPMIYLKAPYVSLLPETLISKTRIPPSEYNAFQGTTILFRGFGNTKVISFFDGNFVKKIEIPNDYIIVEGH